MAQKEVVEETPLHWAAHSGDLTEVNRILFGRSTLATREGSVVDLEALDANGRSALFRAAENDHYSVVNRLLEAGANANTLRQSDQLPLLHRLCALGRSKILKLLIEKGGADVNARHFEKEEENADKENSSRANVRTTTAIDIAFEHAELEIFVELYEKGAELPNEKILSECVMRLAKLGEADLLCRLLNFAKAKSGGEEHLVRSLVHYTDEKGRLPIHYGAKCGHASVIRVLALRKSPLEMRDSRGKTPMELAAAHGRVEAIQELVMAGASAHPNNCFAHLYPAT